MPVQLARLALLVLVVFMPCGAQATWSPTLAGGLRGPWVLLAGACLAAGTWWLRGRQERRRMARLLDDLRAASNVVPEVTGTGNAMEAVRATLRYLSQALSEERSSVRAQAAVRVRVENELRASEERYALALMGADEGWWEWDLKSDKVIYSERWRCMLGLAPEDVGDHIDDWCQRIHPSDRERARADLKAHLDGVSPRFENEHRVLHQDGSYRWVLARATALRSAAGKPQRLVGLATDVTARKQVQQAVVELADGLAALNGDACLRALVRSFAEVLSVREVFICECIDAPATQVRMLARWRGNRYDKCVEFDLAGTACEEVIHSGRLVYQPANAGDRWPVELQYERNSYLGVPCIDSKGNVLGHIACADPGAMPQVLPYEALLRIFAVRAAIELEWRVLARARETLLASSPGGAALSAVGALPRAEPGPVLN